MLKWLQVWDVCSKSIHADFTFDVKISQARGFLPKPTAEASFDIKSIQVDGGSEFIGKSSSKHGGLELVLLRPAYRTVKMQQRRRVRKLII